MTPRAGSIGREGFVERHGLWSEAQAEAAERVTKLVEERGIEMVRLSFADQHGLLRGKAVSVDELALAMRNGCSMTSSLLAKDTSHRTVFPVWSAGGGFDNPEMAGAGDIIMVPDPTTFRVLPWAEATGWMLCDIYFPSGAAVPFSTRRVLADVLEGLEAQGYDFMAGLEVEFHVFRLDDPKLAPEHAGIPADPPEVSLLAHGYQYQTEARLDELHEVLELIRRNVAGLGLPLRTIEIEFGPSQVEFTFDPMIGLEAADAMVLFRSAVKQVCRRHGYHATFMCRPNLANLLSSGWHLHQCLRHKEGGANAFMAADAELSDLGRHYLAGLLEHARAGSLFSTPTINGYKRYQPHSLAPDRVIWGRDNKGAMLRVVGGPGDPGSRIENRIGEPAANPYLYMASQIVAGMDGIERALEPPPPSETPYDDAAERLPASLMEALAALADDPLYRTKLGATFVDYLVKMKQAEIARFLSEVTDWEQREYFENF